MDKLLITPLNEKNYATWKIQLKMALIRDDLWSIVDGSEVAPNDADSLI